MTNTSLIKRDIKRIIKRNIVKIVTVSIFLSFLFYLFNLFGGFTLKLEQIGELVTDKVGIYFYIQDKDINIDEVFKRVLNIKEELTQNGIKSNFSSKEDAFNFLEDKIPNITKNFDKFGIENPLPSTLYVMFNNQKEYETMKDIIIKNKDIILNVKDIDSGASLIQQENRSLKIINIVDTIKNSFHIIAIMLGLIIVFFTQHLLKHFFYTFYEEIEIKKLLGAKYKDVNAGFLITLLLIITLGFVIGFFFSGLSFYVLDKNLITLNIHLTLYDVLPKLMLTYILFVVVSLILGVRMLRQMGKKF